MSDDFVHLFDEDGVPALRRRHLERENARLTAEVAKLQRLLQAQDRQIKALQTQDSAPIRH
jgi:hypothetical protein